MDLSAEYVVVGGGVAGVCCAQELNTLIEEETQLKELSSASDQKQRIILISGRSGFIKVVANAERLGEVAESFRVEETNAEQLMSRHVHVIQDDVCKWNASKHELILCSGNRRIHYSKLCIATGASPKRCFNSKSSNVLCIRDIDSIAQIRAKLTQGVRRLLLIGNGGIATELAFELECVEEIFWAIRHSTIAATYFDEAAAKFFEPKLNCGRRAESDLKLEEKCDRYTVYSKPTTTDGDGEIHSINQALPGGAKEHNLLNPNSANGCALGPHWLAKLAQTHHQSPDNPTKRKIQVLRKTEVIDIIENAEYEHRICSNSKENPQQSSWPMWAEMSNGDWLGFHFAIEAIGVVPNSEFWAEQCTQLELAPDGGILVDDLMRTTVSNVFAAGDVCTLRTGHEKPHWMQARQMGTFCARAMAVENVLPDICFDLFTHVTTFFGYKVILLGDFSATKLEKPYEFHYRINPNQSKADKSADENDGEYIKVVTKNSKIQGAVLIGNTDLEETLENLILNQTDISQIEDDLLNPQIDLEDYFD